MTKNINGREVVFVQVPTGANNYKVYKPLNKYFHIHYDLGGNYSSGGSVLFYKDFGGVKKYPSELTIIGLASSLSEEQWAGIVEAHYYPFLDNEICGYEDYGYHDGFKVFDTATQSGLSLLSSLGMNPQTTLILIKEK